MASVNLGAEARGSRESRERPVVDRRREPWASAALDGAHRPSALEHLGALRPGTWGRSTWDDFIERRGATVILLHHTLAGPFLHR